MRLILGDFSPARLAKYLTFTLLLSMLVSIPSQVYLAPSASANILASASSTSSYGGGTGGSTTTTRDCATGSVVVGATINSVNGFAIWCRALQSNGTLPSDAHTTSNSTKISLYGSTSVNVFCPAGTAATGYRVQTNGYSNGIGLICQTPPAISDAVQFSATVNGAGSWVSVTCPAGRIVVGAWIVTGAWMDRIGGRCATFNLFSVSYNVNGGTGSAPTAQTQGSIGESLTLSSRGSMSRAGFTFAGWNTKADGSGTTYLESAVITPSSSMTLYAQWNSTISYDANADSYTGAAPAATTAKSSAAVTTLATNSGSLARTGFTFAGWNTLPSGAGTNYAAGFTTYASTGNVTLYAQWNSTITYNGNGHTSGGVPTATTAKGTAANTTLAVPGSMVRSGYTFAGWNTQANGKGTDFASGLTTYSSSGNITLYAKWTATITFAPNTATGAATPTSVTYLGSETSVAVQEFAEVGTMVKPGHTLGGWSTAANGSGVTYRESVTVTLPASYLHLLASNFDSSTKVWTNNGSSSRDISGQAVTTTSGSIRGNPWKITTTGQNGASASFPAVKGTTLDGIVLGNEELRSWTICHVARYSGASRGRIITSVDANWLSGFWNGQVGIGFHQAWITSSVGVQTSANIADWRIQCSQGSTGSNSTAFRVNGSDRTSSPTYRTNLPSNISINLSSSRTAPSETSEWEIAEVVIFDRVLSQSQVEYLEGTLRDTYGITSWSNPIDRYPLTGNATLYAKWHAGNYRISYDSNGATSGTMADTNFAAGESIALRANAFVRPGYTFKNWNAVVSGGSTSYSNGQAVTLTANLTLYAQWNLVTPGAPSLTVEPGNSEVVAFPSAAALSNTSGPPTSFVVTAYNSGGGSLGKSCTVVLPATSCTITGLTNGVNYLFRTLARNSTGDSSLNASWISGTPRGVPVLFDATTNGGTTAVMSRTVTARSLTSNVATLTTSTAHGFVVGDSVLVTGIDATFNGTFRVATVPSSTTFTYAKVNSNVASLSGLSATAAKINAVYDKPTAITFPSASRADSTFLGWFDTSATNVGNFVGGAGTSFTPGEAVTLYARFAGITYSITYSGNGNTGGTVPALDSYEANPDSYTVRGDINPPIKIGYRFSGWETSTTGTSATFLPGTKMVVISDLVLYARWIAETYTITYDVNGASGSAERATDSYTYGASAITLANVGTMSRTGYSFGGWSLTSGGNSVINPYTTETSTTLYAIWNPKSYAYSFDDNGGAGFVTSTGSITHGSFLTLPDSTNVTRAGFDFIGWSDGSVIKGAGETLSVTSNLVLVAQWRPRSYLVSYSGNGADSGSTLSGSFTAGGLPYAIAENGFSKIGHTFTTWNSAADASGSDFSPGTGYETPTALVLYAQWQPKTITISFDGNGATGSSTQNSMTWSYGDTPPTLASVGTLERIGYFFAGWAAAPNDNVALTNPRPSEDVTYYALWSLNSYTLTYDPGEGSGIPFTVQREYLSSFTTDSGASFTRTDSPTVTYVLGFWKDSQDRTYSPGSTYVMPARHETLTAQWIAIYTVTYNADGGNTALPAVQMQENDTITVGVAATRSGYDFLGWVSQNGTLFDPGDSATVTSDQYIFSARWQARSYSINLDVNGAQGTAPNAGTYMTDGLAFQLPANSTSLQKAGYSFDGWNTQADGLGTSYPVGSSLTTTANLTLFARWKANTYTITYNGNGATAGSSPTTSNYLTGAGAHSVESSSLIKTGSSFIRWNTSANGSGVDYSPGDSLTATSNITLYAQWGLGSYAITYATDGGSGSPSESDKAFGSSFTLASAPTKNGFIFLGWKSERDTNLYLAGASYTMGPIPDTFTAQWSPITYPITFQSSGGSSTPSSQNIAFGSDLTLPAAITRDGYIFTGWRDGSTTYQPGDTLTITSNLTFLAEWVVAAPGTPSISAALPGDGSASISVTPSSSGGSAISYRVTAYSGATEVGDCLVISPATTCIIAGLTNGEPYTFSATASNNTGTSSPSTASGEVTPAGLPGIPTAVDGSGVGTVTDLTWETPLSDGGSAITDYIIEYRVAGSADAWTTFTDGVSSDTDVTVTGLIFPNKYEFRVKACNSIGCSLPSLTSAPVTNLPTPPRITRAIALDASVEVEIDSSTVIGSVPLTSIEVITYQDTEVAGTCSAPLSTGTCTVQGLNNGTEYSFTAIALTLSLESEPSEALTAIPATVPEPPDSVTAVATQSGMTVTFTAPENNGGSAITGYRVTPSPSGPTCSVGANATTFNCTGLTPGQGYSFSAVAINAAGDSFASPSSEITTALDRPGAPVNVAATITATGATLNARISFEPPSSDGGAPITGYVVTASPGGATCTVPAGSTSCDIATLSDGSYSFAVVAMNDMGNSNSASTTSLKASNGTVPVLVSDSAPVTSTVLQATAILIAQTEYSSLPIHSTSYQWKRCEDASDLTTCVDITGATSATYQLTDDDVYSFIRVQTTATNSIGSAQNISQATEAVQEPPTPAPAGTLRSGNSLTAPSASGSLIVSSLRHVWKRCEDQTLNDCTDIAGATSATYSLTSADVGKLMRVQIVIEHSLGVMNKLSEPTTAIAAAPAPTPGLSPSFTPSVIPSTPVKSPEVIQREEESSKKVEELAKKVADKSEVTKSKAERFIEKVIEATESKVRAEQAAAEAKEKLRVAEEAKAVAEKSAANALESLRDETASARDQESAKVAAAESARTAQQAVAQAAKAAKVAAQQRVDAAKATKSLDIAINSLTSMTAASQKAAEANAVAAAAKRAATKAAEKAQAAATKAADNATFASNRVAVAAKAVATAKENAAIAITSLQKSTDRLLELSRDRDSKSVDLAAKVGEIQEKIELQRLKAEEAEAVEDLTEREKLIAELEEIALEIESSESEAARISEEMNALSTEISQQEGLVEIATANAKTFETEAANAGEDLEAKRSAAIEAQIRADAAKKAAQAAKAAAKALPAVVVAAQTQSVKSGKNKATATITGLKPGQKVKVTVKVGRR